MKHILRIAIFFLIFSGFGSAFAEDSLQAVESKIGNFSHVDTSSDVTRSEVFIFMGDFYQQYAPESYKYIDIKFKGVSNTGDLHEALQVLVYLDLIKNSQTNIYPQKKLIAADFYTLSEKVFGVNFRKEDNETLKKRYTNISDLLHVSESIKKINDSSPINVENGTSTLDVSSSTDSESIAQKKAIFGDVYKTILSRHYDRNDLDEEEIIYSAIQGLANGTGDKYTTYFPPVENKDFQESLSGEFEGIGSYVDMPTPGVIEIISPIVGSPSEKAGIKGGDIIIKIDDKIVTEKMSLKEAVSYIKGPAGTVVNLTIRRGTKTFDVKVIRAKIVIKEVEYKSLRTDTFYIQIKTFGDTVDSEFKQALEVLKTKKGTKKLIIDVRNNPGGYLGKVNNILGYFVEKGEPVSVVQYQKSGVSHKSKGYDLVDFSDYQIIFLQNGGTASASEILVGTIKDYYPSAVIIGETSFGKGSVQDIKSYTDGSSLKFTIAKWFTGKTKKGIDGIGISPDIEIKLDDEKFQKGIDNQLDEALKIR